MGLGKNCRMSTVLRQSWTPLVPALPNILPREKVTDAFLLPFPDDFFTSFFSPAGQHSPSPSSSSPSQVAHCTPLLCSALLSSPQRSTLFKTCDIFLQGGMGLLISSVSQSVSPPRPLAHECCCLAASELPRQTAAAAAASARALVKSEAAAEILSEDLPTCAK